MLKFVVTLMFVASTIFAAEKPATKPASKKGGAAATQSPAPKAKPVAKPSGKNVKPTAKQSPAPTKARPAAAVPEMTLEEWKMSLEEEGIVVEDEVVKKPNPTTPIGKALRATVGATTSVSSAPVSSTTTTASVDVVKKNRNKSEYYFGVALGAVGLSSFNTQDPQVPTGFQLTSSSQKNEWLDLSIILQYWNGIVRLEYSPIPMVSKLDLEFYGSDFGGPVKVIRSNKTLLNGVFGIDPNWFLSVGVGGELVKFSGNFSMGGFSFTNIGEGWAPVLKIGVLRKVLHNTYGNFQIGVFYEWTQARVTIEAGLGVPKIIGTEAGTWKVQVMGFAW